MFWNVAGMWVSASEESFALRLQEELKEALESKTVLTQRVEQLQVRDTPQSPIKDSVQLLTKQAD